MFTIIECTFSLMLTALLIILWGFLLPLLRMINFIYFSSYRRLQSLYIQFRLCLWSCSYIHFNSAIASFIAAIVSSTKPTIIINAAKIGLILSLIHLVSSIFSSISYLKRHNVSSIKYKISPIFNLRRRRLLLGAGVLWACDC